MYILKNTYKKIAIDDDMNHLVVCQRVKHYQHEVYIYHQESKEKKPTEIGTDLQHITPEGLQFLPNIRCRWLLI